MECFSDRCGIRTVDSIYFCLSRFFFKFHFPYFAFRSLSEKYDNSSAAKQRNKNEALSAKGLQACFRLSPVKPLSDLTVRYFVKFWRYVYMQTQRIESERPLNCGRNKSEPPSAPPYFVVEFPAMLMPTSNVFICFSIKKIECGFLDTANKKRKGTQTTGGAPPQTPDRRAEKLPLSTTRGTQLLPRH